MQPRWRPRRSTTKSPRARHGATLAVAFAAIFFLAPPNARAQSDQPTKPSQSEGSDEGEHGHREDHGGHVGVGIQIDLGRLFGGGNHDDNPQPPSHGPLITQMEDCSWARAGGWFQPVQGVYQDDPDFPKTTLSSVGAPKENPLLEEQALASYMAWLPMVAGRDTILMGVEKYRNASGTVRAGDHSEIVVKGWSNCQTDVPVKLQFDLQDSSGTRTIYTTPVVGTFPLKGPKLRDGRIVPVHVISHEGFPLPDEGTFKIASGSYFLTAEIVREDNSHTGIFVSVAGSSVVTYPPTVKFLPLIFTRGPIPPRLLSDFRGFGQELADGAHHFIPDYFPLVRDGLPTFTVEPKTFADLDPKGKWLHGDSLIAQLTDYVGTTAMLGGADRVVVLLRYWKSQAFNLHPPAPHPPPVSALPMLLSDYERIVGPGSVGDTESTKVVYVSADANVGAIEAGGARGSSDTPPIVETVAHELVHTLPVALWTGPVGSPAPILLQTKGFQFDHDMVRDCGRDYHNLSLFIANGERIDVGGYDNARQRVDGRLTIMGPSETTRNRKWITQCTYAHLIWSMLIKPDPALMLVRAIVSRAGGKPGATLLPGYDLEGTADAEPGNAQGWAVTLRDGSGKPMATYALQPVWYSDGNEHDAAAVALRVPATPGAAMLEVDYDGNILAGRPISPAPPEFAITSARIIGKNKARIAWRGSSAGYTQHLASVFYSSNGGRWYDEQIFEQDVGEAEGRLDPRATNHMIKVVVTDGSRSAERVATLH